VASDGGVTVVDAGRRVVVWGGRGAAGGGWLSVAVTEHRESAGDPVAGVVELGGAALAGRRGLVRWC
jgi:hypothetical protein